MECVPDLGEIKVSLKMKIDAKFMIGNLENFLKRLGGSSFIKKMNKDIENYMVQSTRKKINDSDFKDGNTPLSSLTAKNRVKGGKPLYDRGNLFRSIRGYSDLNKITIGSNHVAARIHNRGGIIKPKKSQTLVLPASRLVKSKYGYGKFDLKTVLKNMKKDGYTISWTPRAILGRKNKGQIEVLFVRKKSVKIPKRTYLWISDYDKKNIDKIFEKNIANIEI